ncbi:phospholipase D family protein [Roseococcus sp. YIM B11640]|uniref:phospholipase D family protein n=1 Tax=Roseococcus sp. YIM B11640 TaxID=3133973 RepID=UPI003C7C70D6
MEQVAEAAPPPPAGSHPPGATSEVGLLADGGSAFWARMHSARAATRTLDLQYYLWASDVTGRLLVRELLAAADRGVRVRLLIDDLYGLGHERAISALNGHPMITVRWFNASRWRKWGWVGFASELLFGNWHLNRRMHNKAWITDGEQVICGGRNIGDRYFDAPADFNFRDLDIEVKGEAAQEAVAAFEAYWRSPLSRPVSRLPRMRTRKSLLKRFRRRLEDSAASAGTQEVLRDMRGLRRRMERGLDIANDAIRIIADPPDKARGQAESAIGPVVAKLLASAQREALLISPYFVPGEAGTRSLIGLVERGVRVSVITNSLAATDVVAVHGGYARYRQRLLEAGVEIFELRSIGETKSGVFGSRGASLHTKAVLVDDGPSMIGSFNLDPRSIDLNTEMAVLIQHSALTRLVRRLHAKLAAPERSWKLGLEGGRLTWNGTPGREPDATWRRRALAWTVGCLPIESQL